MCVCVCNEHFETHLESQYTTTQGWWSRLTTLSKRLSLSPSSFSYSQFSNIEAYIYVLYMHESVCWRKLPKHWRPDVSDYVISYLLYPFLDGNDAKCWEYTLPLHSMAVTAVEVHLVSCHASCLMHNDINIY